MAWIATDDFNSYSAGDLGTLNGGSGWSAGWVDGGGTISVATDAAYEGINGVTAAASAAALYTRAITTAVTAGTMYVNMKSSSTSSVFYFILTESGNGRMYIKFDSDGNIKIYDNGSATYQTITAYAANTWYQIAINWDTAVQANKYRASVNNSAYTSYYTVTGGTFTNITGVILERDNTVGNVYWDRISDAPSSLTTGIVSYWKLDESSGNAADSVGSNTLTNNNSTAYATGKINNGIDFENSSSQYLSISDGTQTGLDIVGNLSISFWWKPESHVAFTWLVAKYVLSGNQRSYGVYYDTGNTLNFAFSNNGTATSGAGYSFTPVDGTWYHIVVTYNTSGTQTIYVNGSVLGTTSGLATSIYNSTADFWVGGGNNDPDVDGLMDEVGIWSKTLTSLEVAALYNSGNGLAYPLNTAYSFNSFDSDSIRQSNATFSTAHDAVTGTSRNDTYNLIGCYLNAGSYEIERGFETFDTSLVGDGDTITGVTLKVRIEGVAGSSVSFNVFNSTHTDTIVDGDYDLGGTTAYASAVSIADITVGQDVTFTFNATGIAAINKTGYTKFCIRQVENDVANSAPGSGVVRFWYTNGSGSSNKPILTVTISSIQNLVMAATTATFALTGIDTTLLKLKMLVADVASYILTGMDAILVQIGTHWTNESKNNSTWSNQSKNTSTWSNQIKY